MSLPLQFVIWNYELHTHTHILHNSVAEYVICNFLCVCVYIFTLSLSFCYGFNDIFQEMICFPFIFSTDDLQKGWRKTWEFTSIYIPLHERERERYVLVISKCGLWQPIQWAIMRWGACGKTQNPSLLLSLSLVTDREFDYYWEIQEGTIC